MKECIFNRLRYTYYGIEIKDKDEEEKKEEEEKKLKEKKEGREGKRIIIITNIITIRRKPRWRRKVIR